MSEPTNQPSIEPITREDLAEIVNFLCGAAPLDGVWYSCAPPKGKPRFWWRPKLRAALSASEAREKKLREALECVMTGGNHIATHIAADHPPYTATAKEALAHYGATMKFDIWCCWQSIMRARQALGE